MPRNFFENYVRPNHEAWLASPLDERLAKNAVGDANDLAARAFHHWKVRDPSQINGAASEGQYRNELAIHECTDFSLVRDVADAHKHVELDRPSRRVTRSEQTGPASMGFGDGGFGEGPFGGGLQLVIRLDDGSKRSLTAVMKNVMEMWERLLTRWSW